MRSILFRGKRIDTGEWVKGYYVVLYDGKHNKHSYRIYTGFSEYDCGDYFPEFFEVDPNTVSQYTESDDIKNTKIFCDDIIKIKYPIHSEVGKVVYKWNGWYIEPQTKDLGTLSLSVVCSDHEVNIIGNIHDNPELLEARL